MKKLVKLKLKPEKMLSHDELLSYRGGSCDLFGGVCSTWECCVCVAVCYGDCAVDFEDDPQGQNECESACPDLCNSGV